MVSKINYKHLGTEDCPINSEDEEIGYIGYRLENIQKLEVCAKNLRILTLRNNLIRKIEGLELCTQLEELELYDNKIVKIEGLSTLKKLQ